MAMAVALLTTACGQPEPPPKEERLLVIDGIEIRFSDLQPYYDFLKESRPELGVKSTYIWAMRDHVLPVMVARRAFPKERAELLERAQALCSVASNILELEKNSELIVAKTRSNLTRINARLPVAKFLFVEEMTGAVSPPIELPDGYFVVGAYDYNKSQLTIADYVDALQVGFVTHTGKEWVSWWEAEQKRIGDKVTFVHPDYRDNLPKWMKLPKEKQS